MDAMIPHSNAEFPSFMYNVCTDLTVLYCFLSVLDELNLERHGFNNRKVKNTKVTTYS